MDEGQGEWWLNPGEVDKAWIGTFSGRRFHLLDPQPSEIDIFDIAHALSQQCRYTGHTRFHYSIAQHSCYVAQLVPKEMALAALLHDASEAYLSDLSRPVKRYTPIGEVYREVENRIQGVINKVFSTGDTEHPLIKLADRQLMWAEILQLMPGQQDFSEKWGTPDPANVGIQEFTPKDAETDFLRDFELYGGWNG